MKPPKSIPLTGWKRDFADKEIIPIKGHGFMVVSVTKRGLALRHVRPESKTDADKP